MRPSLLTPEVHQTIVATIKLGGYLTTAAARAGIGASTITDWMALGRRHLLDGKDSTYARLVTEVRQVEGEAETRAVALLQRAMVGGDVKAITWYLSHRFPTRWADRVSVDARLEVDAAQFEAAVDELANLVEGVIEAGPTGDT